MPRYIPNTDIEQKGMLEKIGCNSIDDLFREIPKKVRFNGELDLPAPLSEIELEGHMRELAGKNIAVDDHVCFLGAGAYDHYVPSLVGHITSRQEFYTAYTPYQPEISQGTLQAIFEYQTMICELTGMDVSNASMYDGATALAEAVSMACQATRRKEVLVANTVHPESRSVLKTYGHFSGYIIKEIGYKNGQLDLEALEAAVTSNTAAVVLQSPNFLGIIEDLSQAAVIAHKHKAIFITAVDPISLSILKSPGEVGVDLVVGEGQALGNRLSYGGPYLGFLAAKSELLRKMPGRIVGETDDSSGKRGFVLTIQAREQHIRREKATSNICSNQALNALAATVYLTVMGKTGLRKTAELCLHKAHYTYDQLLKTGKFEEAFSAPFFKEFTLKAKAQVYRLNEKLLENKIIGGYDLSCDYPEIDRGWLLAVTEKRTREQIDLLVAKVRCM